jgi:hypothetical protein
MSTVVKKVDIFSKVDWKTNIHVAYNPHNIVVNLDEYDWIWKRFFSVPFVKQKSPEWLEVKKDFISGSESAAAGFFELFFKIASRRTQI